MPLSHTSGDAVGLYVPGSAVGKWEKLCNADPAIVMELCIYEDTEGALSIGGAMVLAQ